MEITGKRTKTAIASSWCCAFGIVLFLYFLTEIGVYSFMLILLMNQQGCYAQVQCAEFFKCDTCTTEAGCVWCASTQTCVNRVNANSCSNWHSDPVACFLTGFQYYFQLTDIDSPATAIHRDSNCSTKQLRGICYER